MLSADNRAARQLLNNPASMPVVAADYPSFSPCHIFPTADGAFFLAVSNDYQFSELCALAGQPQWLADTRFASHLARCKHAVELTEVLRRCTVEHRTEEWMAALRWAGVPCAALAPHSAQFVGYG
jgi:crotonobetainyl-CoA:carnitine CoA-transferase CaiB-like acyl-CoA transferase